MKRSLVAVACTLLLAGCYAEAGLGYAGHSYASGHGSVGLVAHFGEVGSIRAGGGVAIGGYEPASGRTGSIWSGPIVFGGHARLAGEHNSLVVTADVHEPHLGTVSFRDPDMDERAPTTRGFIGLGYRHSWRAAMPKDSADVPRVKGSVTLAAGPEVFWASPVQGSDTNLGAAVSVMVELRPWVFWAMLECFSDPSKKDDC